MSADSRCVQLDVFYLDSCMLIWIELMNLTHKQLETHGCVLSAVASDGLVLKHQGISFHSAD